MEEDGIDDRFKKVLTDPRFKKFPSKGKKIKVDSRFEGMFDKRFNGEPLVDKRGKRVKNTDNDALRKFYEVEENVKKLRGEDNDLESSSSDESSDEEEEVEAEDENQTAEQIDSEVLRSDNITCRFAVTNVDWDQLKAVDLFVLFNSFKPSNGEILSVKIYLSEFGKERIEAEKIEGPKELTDVKLEEDEEDPYGTNVNDTDEIINTDCPFVSEKLRKYQLNRLKYYYAVVECDSPDTASALYDQLDGMEYESSASTLDLRFIPDEMSFDDEPTSVCHEMPSLIDYKPPIFITTALQQTKVRLTWDETDPKRAKTLQRAFTERDKISDDLACYLASSSDEEADELSEDEDNMEGKSLEDRIKQYKDLLKNVEEEGSEDEKDIDMEVKWEPELENIGQKIVEKKQKEKMNVAERKMAERKERHAERKKLKKQAKAENIDSDDEDDDESGEDNEDDEYDEDHDVEDDEDDEVQQSDEPGEDSDNQKEADQDDLELLVMDPTKKDKKHFDYNDYVENKKSKKKWKKKKRNENSKQQEDNFEFNPDDSRFSAIYKSHLYNVDQSNSHFKKTKAYDEILKRKASIDPDSKYKMKKSK